MWIKALRDTVEHRPEICLKQSIYLNDRKQNEEAESKPQQKALVSTFSPDIPFWTK